MLEDGLAGIEHCLSRRLVAQVLSVGFPSLGHGVDARGHRDDLRAADRSGPRLLRPLGWLAQAYGGRLSRTVARRSSGFVECFRRLQAILPQPQLQVDVARFSGGESVIRQPEGLVYIQEPVMQGDNVVMILVIARTRLGEGCRLTDWVPIFTDELNIPTPGERSASCWGSGASPRPTPTPTS